MKAQTESRKLNDLKVTNEYLRLGTDVSDLEKSIQTIGLIAPLVVSSDNIILAGARRYQALLNLGYTEAPVVVIEHGALERELVSIDENLVRKDLTKIEIEGHLRRAKEIYVALHPEEKVEKEKITTHLDSEENHQEKKEILPAERFLNIISEKTGLSSKQIHEAISRDELADSSIKKARQNGELSISQTNEIVKLKKDEQKKALEHIKSLPVREIKKFVKEVKSNGVEKAIMGTPKASHAREFEQIESILKRLQKKLIQLELESITFNHFPENLQNLFSEVAKYSDSHYPLGVKASNNIEDIYQ